MWLCQGAVEEDSSWKSPRDPNVGDGFHGDDAASIPLITYKQSILGQQKLGSKQRTKYRELQNQLDPTPFAIERTPSVSAYI